MQAEVTNSDEILKNPPPAGRKSTSFWLTTLLFLAFFGSFWLCLGDLLYFVTPETPGFQILPPLSEVPAPPTIPSAEKFIVLDAGHGGDDPGTQGNGLLEKNGTLPIAISIAKELELKGFKVILTRKEDTTLSLETRSMLANAAQRHCFISVHLNHSDTPKSSGIETYYAATKRLEVMQAFRKELKATSLQTISDQRGKLLAEAVHRSAIEASHANDREVKNNPNLFVLNAIACPSILIECGFVSNKAEKANLIDPVYQQKLAKGIADGVEEFLKAVEANPSYGIEITPSS